jgi:hypothetical protein
VYAPAFAAAVTDNDAGGVSAYLLVAGATFFGATQIARDYTITPAMLFLSTHASLHAAAAGGSLPYIFGGSDNDDAAAAGIFVGALAGTAGGLVFGNRMTTGDAAATGFGSDVAALTMVGLILAAQGGEDADDLGRADAALVLGAAAAGYPLGYIYPRSVRYKVSAGDVGTLWLSGLLGISTASMFLVDSDPGLTAGALTITGGFLGGIVAGDRIFVKRFDHTAGEAALLGLGGIAGSLVGLGVANLIEDGDNERLNVGLGTAAAMAGIAATHLYIAPRGDEGRFSNIRFTPGNAALAAAARIPGRYPVLSVSF